MEEIVKRAINRTLPRSINCPVCGNRHYPMRIETKHYFEDGLFDVLCGCGAWYQVINRGAKCVIRRKSV